MAPDVCQNDAMDLAPYVDTLRHELASAAEAADPAARALAERLTAPLESAARLTLLNALSAAMGEVTRELAPGSVDVRLRGLDPEFVVTPPPAQEPYVAPGELGPGRGASLAPSQVPSVPSQVPSDDEDGGLARVNLRLPTHLKSRIEDAAGQEGLSVNAWLVRAIASVLEPPGGGNQQGRTRKGQQSYTGWVR
jgi:hypothetical protein